MVTEKSEPYLILCTLIISELITCDWIPALTHIKHTVLSQVLVGPQILLIDLILSKIHPYNYNL